LPASNVGSAPKGDLRSREDAVACTTAMCEKTARSGQGRHRPQPL